MKSEDFDGIVAGLTEAIDYGKGKREGFRVHVPASVNVKAIRKSLALTQDAFAARFGFSPGAVRDWEQGRKQPEATARVLLTVISKEPEAVSRALALT